MEEDWEETEQRLLGSGAELRNPESQQLFAVQNVALQHPFNWKALWTIMAFCYYFKARELCQEHYYLQSRVCQGIHLPLSEHFSLRNIVDSIQRMYKSHA